MKIEKLLSLISDDLLVQLALDTRVDHYAKKLQGEVIFKLLLYCIVSHKDNSLRTMESAYEKVAFKLLNQKYNQDSIRFSSISERLSNINVAFFEKIYLNCINAYKKDLGNDGENLIRFDSTIIALSTRLLEIGYQLQGGNAEDFKQLKFTIGFSDIPEIVHFYHEQKYTSENVALKQTIAKQAEIESKTIKVFDKGITARNTYDEFTEKDIRFVTRLNTNARHTTIRLNDDSVFPLETSTLTIVNDTWCYLYNSNKQRTKHPVRRIETIRIADNEPIVFITNIHSLSAAEVTEIYKRRWDIEVFFKFIKQLLNFKHLLNRSENGIKVVLYVTMIAAILLIAYKKTNHLKGFKIVKQKFEQELETIILKDLIVMCGGNPELLGSILSKRSP
jgi:hypothetical protein